MLLLGYIVTLFAMSYALAHRRWIGKVRECLIHALLRQSLVCCSGQQGWSMKVTLLLNPSGRDFLTYSMPLVKVQDEVPMKG